MNAMPPTQLLDTLEMLLPAQFEALMHRFAMPPTLVRRNVSQTEQALDLIHYAQGQNRIQELMVQVQSVQSSDAGLNAFQQAQQQVGQQFNVAGNMTIHGDVVAGDKIVHRDTGHENPFAGSGDPREDKQ